MVDMKVLGLTMGGENNTPILVLQEKGGAEILPSGSARPKLCPYRWLLTARRLTGL